jgi:hypothetical protein
LTRLFGRVFFLPVVLAWLQANEDCVLLDGADGSKRPLRKESRSQASAHFFTI